MLSYHDMITVLLSGCELMLVTIPQNTSFCFMLCVLVVRMQIPVARDVWWDKEHGLTIVFKVWAGAHACPVAALSCFFQLFI